MAVAFTFPGQGSQSVGMGKDIAEAFPQARAVFDEVDEALGEKLSSIIWNGPENELTLTANAQPALMAVSIAAIRALEAEGVRWADRIAYVAGHSLGEYTALCAAGMFSLADTARLLRTRGQAMQRAVPVGRGAMAAILGLEFDQVEKICEQAVELGVCQIANDNGAGQIVISGEKPAVERAAEIAAQNGAKRALMLPVSAPFHCDLMKPAADEMRRALASVEKIRPVVPLIPNVSVEPQSEPDEIAALLVEQVTGKVRWRETVTWFAAHGVSRLCEIGAGKVLTGLARRIDKSLDPVAVNSPQDIRMLAEQLA